MKENGAEPGALLLTDSSPFVQDSCEPLVHPEDWLGVLSHCEDPEATFQNFPGDLPALGKDWW